jgi:hypothetical protein
MFELWAGEEKFQQGVRDYLNAHANGNATAHDSSPRSPRRPAPAHHVDVDVLDQPPCRASMSR